MRLQILDNGHSFIQKIQMKMIRTMMGGLLPGPIAIQSYRPDFFGRVYNDTVMMGLRETTEWHKSEAELFAAFVSFNNRCNFCFGAHSAIAVKGIDQAVLNAVFEDWRTAPVNEKIRASLGFLEKLTKTPAEVSEVDVNAVLDAGVSRQGLEEVIQISFVFSLINRLADAFDFELGDYSSRKRMGLVLYNLGYGLAIVPG